MKEITLTEEQIEGIIEALENSSDALKTLITIEFLKSLLS